MLPNVSKCLHLSIWCSSMRMKFQLLPLILVVPAVEVSPSTASSDADDSSSSASVSSSSVYFSLFFPNWFRYLLSKTLVFLLFIFVFFFALVFIFVALVSSFLLRWFRIFVFSILSFLSRQVCELSQLFCLFELK